jgi:molybdopterin-containing oxidoreductase family membrane subunit
MAARVIGVFAAPDAAARAISALRAARLEDVDVAMPAPFPEVLAALGRPRSRLGAITWSGALLGLAAGIALPVSTSLAWPLVVGGKPIVAVPAFVVIFFELTVLVGSLTNLVGSIALGWSGGGLAPLPGGREFHGDRIGIFVRSDDPEKAEAVLRAEGAEEVRRV